MTVFTYLVMINKKGWALLPAIIMHPRAISNITSSSTHFESQAQEQGSHKATHRGDLDVETDYSVDWPHVELCWSCFSADPVPC